MMLAIAFDERFVRRSRRLAVVDVDGQSVPGMAPAVFVVGAPLLRTDEQVFEAMIQGWSDQ